MLYNAISLNCYKLAQKNFMKKLLTLLLIVAFFSNARAQELTWYNNLDKAIEISKQTSKPLMLFFTGSDWCGWCHRLQNEVFKLPEFVTWAKSSVVLVEVDFPRAFQLAPEIQNQNNHLQQDFQIQGYPTVWFVNATKKDGSITYERLGQTGYVAGGPPAWLQVANGFLKKK